MGRTEVGCAIGFGLLALGYSVDGGGLGVGIHVGVLGSTPLIFVPEPDEAVAVLSLSFVCHAQP